MTDGLSADQLALLIVKLEKEVWLFNKCDEYWGGHANGCQYALDEIEKLRGQQ